MATSAVKSPEHQAESTFRKYSAGQAAAYTKGRASYNPALYDYILDFHESTGGKYGLVMDIGCGPGNSTRPLGAAFDDAVGLDPSQGMINEATSLGGTARSGSPIRYVLGEAEKCNEVEGIPEGSVDLITAATAAHWFDMQKFWPAAAKALRPGGTFAAWICTSIYCDPTQPNAAEIQAEFAHLDDVVLAPYNHANSHLPRSAYTLLTLPWDLPESNPGRDAFDQAASKRKDWNKEGECAPGEDYFHGASDVTVERCELLLSTASSVTRWREAHPDLVGTEKDCLKECMNKIKGFLGERTTFKAGLWTALILVKRKA